MGALPTIRNRMRGDGVSFPGILFASGVLEGGALTKKSRATEFPLNFAILYTQRHQP